MTTIDASSPDVDVGIDASEPGTGTVLIDVSSTGAGSLDVSTSLTGSSDGGLDVSSPPADPLDLDARPGTIIFGGQGLDDAVADYIASHPDSVVSPAVLQAHITSPTPHPAYDVDIQDLATLYRSRLA